MKTDWVTWLIQTLIGIGFAIVAYFWKKDQASLQARLEKVECRLDAHDGQLANMPFVYVTKDDFIRAMSGVSATINENQRKTDAKLDKIYDLMLELKKEN
jgi:hypothetical protein